MQPDPVSRFQLAHLQVLKYESFTRLFMEDSARQLVEAAGLGPGEVVLDLACGTGLVARHALARVGVGGRVTGVDINPPMLEAARTVVEAPIELVEASAEALPFEDGTFTHVLSQQGFQFFPDPVKAVREVRRVLRPGGMLVATVWATPGLNPYIETQLELIERLDPGSSVSVRIATPANADVWLRAIATDGGLRDVEVALVEHVSQLPALEHFFLDQTASTPWAPVLERLSTEERLAVASEFARRLGDYENGDQYAVPFRSYRLTARS